MYTYEFLWHYPMGKNGTGHVDRMYVRYHFPNTNDFSEGILIGWGRNAAIKVHGMGTDNARVVLKNIPMEHLRAVTDEIVAEHARRAEVIAKYESRKGKGKYHGTQATVAKES